MAAYVITNCRSRKSAETTRKWYEKREIPVNIRKINEHRYLIVTDPEFTVAAKMAR